MAKRSLIVFALTLVLVTSAVPVRHVHGILLTPDEVALLDATSRDDDGQSKGDNTFVRVLKAPIKAIGRLFGVGKKDENKPERLSRKDVKKFESVGAAKVVDARTTGFETPAATAATENAAVVDPALAPARENLERGRALINSGKADPEKIRFYIGYSGWSPGQLDTEMTEKTWLTVEAVRKLVFHPNAEEIWRDSLRHLGGEFEMMINFPIDPQLN